MQHTATPEAFILDNREELNFSDERYQSSSFDMKLKKLLLGKLGHLSYSKILLIINQIKYHNKEN